jgi:hypothetical protein
MAREMGGELISENITMSIYACYSSFDEAGIDSNEIRNSAREMAK